jgi:PAS domain S-box-containing protein
LTSTAHVTEQNYKQLFSQALVPIAIYKGRELVYTFVNEAYSKIFHGREILGKTVREAFPELEGQPFFEILENVYDSGKPYYGQEVPAIIDVENNGSPVTRYYNLVYSPFKNENGKIEGVMALGLDVTDQVELRKKETEADNRFRNIVEQSIDPILILKGENLVLDVANEPLFQIWNVGKEAIGRPLLDILPEMKEQEAFGLLQDVYHNQVTHLGYETPIFFIRSNGVKELLYFDFVYQPYRESDGTVSGVLILATNVTERVLAKNKARERDNNFRNMILQAPVAMAVLKTEKHIVEIANDRMFELWGVSKEEAVNKPIFEALPTAKGQGLEPLLDHVFQTGETFVANERPVDLPRNGKIQTTWLNFVYEAMKEGDGSISGIIAVANEVTDQVMARKNVELAEERARLAIESGDLGTYEVNMLTNEVVTSPRFNEIWGFEKAVSDRSAYTAVIHPDDLQVRKEAHRRSLETGNLEYEVRIIRKGQNIHWIRVKGRIIYSEAGVPVTLIGVIQDITEQKLFAAALADQVDERTKELKLANDRLKKTNEELEQFAYVASHDLQEPLRKIQVFSSIMMEEPGFKDEAGKYPQKINDSAKRMTGLIRDLLDYSRLSQSANRFEMVKLSDILKNVSTDFELLITQKKAEIISDPLPEIQAIPLQMNQLFFNLIGNALKFSKKNVPPVVHVTSTLLSPEDIDTTWHLKPARVYYKITIKDNGIGFHQDYATRIFTIFQRLNERTVYGGYGIGLALCRKIVSNHGGIIYAEAKPNEGAAFTFVLPYRQN